MFDWLVELLYECWQGSQKRLVEDVIEYCPWLVVDRSFGEWLAAVDRLGFYADTPYVGYRHMLPDGYCWHFVNLRKDQSAILYRPQLDELSHEDFDAQYHLVAELDRQLNCAVTRLNQMREAYGRTKGS